MTLRRLFSVTTVALLICLMFNSCKKAEEPNVINKTVTDIDGNVYHTIIIGSQTWMVENLKTTRYRDGSVIGTTSPTALDISIESTPKYQWAHGGDETNVATYGRLYTWYAATDSRNICPSGWHLPTDQEWTTLTNYLSDNGFSQSSFKEDIAKSMASTILWADSYLTGTVGINLSSNNRSGFTALPGSYRSYFGLFGILGTGGVWWTATIDPSKMVIRRYIAYDGSRMVSDHIITHGEGFSIRCIKD